MYFIIYGTCFRHAFDSLQLQTKTFLLNELFVYKSKLDYSCVICFLFDRWEVDDWGPCSKTCGGGFRERKVSCVSDRGGKKIKVRKHKSVNYDLSFKTI